MDHAYLLIIIGAFLARGLASGRLQATVLTEPMLLAALISRMSGRASGTL